MELVGDRRVYAPSDLVDFIACAHLATLGRAVAAGERARPEPTEEERLVARKGDAHEAAYLSALAERGIAVTDVPRAASFAGRRDAARITAEAMRAGAPAIHNATFVDVPALGDAWAGVADFAIRVPGASDLGDYHYEIWDAKLARNAKPSAVVQTGLYADLLARVQGRMPAHIHLILGGGPDRIATFRTDEVLPYVRAARARFVAAMAAEPVTYPEPVPHCARCRFRDTVCAPRRRADDHLGFVANIRRSQMLRLHAAGIDTLASLADAPDGARPQKLAKAPFETLRAQAKLQRAARADGVARYELLKPREGCGFARLPEPDAGDVYFDIEGDPFYDADGAGQGLEYLFGFAFLDERGDARFDSFAGHDRAGERDAFAAFVDFVIARRERHPHLHVYHYAAYESTALRRLAAKHAVREAEVDVLLRERVLVDLFDVVRQALRASFESYSLKKIEHFFRGERREAVASAFASVVAYETFLDTREPALFEEIVRYNREDCLSTLALHRWLRERRDEAQRYFETTIPWRAAIEAPPVPEEAGERDALARELAPGRPLAAHLLGYHRREAKPAWWAFFDRLDRTPEELVEDHEALGAVSAREEQPELFNRSRRYRFEFPPQEHKLKPGGTVYAPNDPGKPGKPRAAGTVVAVDDAAGIVVVQRGPKIDADPFPHSFCPDGPIKTDPQRDALLRFGQALRDDGCATRFRACKDLLDAAPPRLIDRERGAAIDRGATTPEELAALVGALDESYLFVQGPPGAGKTYVGARAIVTLIARGLRVGVASTSHKAIHHLLDEIGRVAAARGVAFRGYKKRSSNSEESAYDRPGSAIEDTNDVAPCASDRGASLVAGTAWLFADERMEDTLDVLAIDEAGQVALADAIAMTTSARNVVLLGDPMQLAQVAQGSHPDGAEASVLSHLLGDRATVPADRGIFLPHTFRMHASICAYVSAIAYDGRLGADPSCANRRIEAGAIGGAGLRYLPVPHEGNVQRSTEEAEAIATAVEDVLRAGTVTDRGGVTRALAERDVLVVAPYNMQVRRLREVLDARGFAGVRAGTVDKFQGQEAPVVFYSMAASSGEEAPRGIDFLFDRRRLNVAISRAEALAVLVCSPRLLETPATTVEALVTIGALCRLAQEALPLRGPRERPPEQLALLG